MVHQIYDFTPEIRQIQSLAVLVATKSIHLTIFYENSGDVPVFINRKKQLNIRHVFAFSNISQRFTKNNYQYRANSIN
tara:strand:- start:277 stop:510 length:234 start_codon:yes stop_codon:yes gene_type:complete